MVATPRNIVGVLLALLASFPVYARNITICHDFGCKAQTEVDVSPPLVRSLAGLFEPPPKSAAEERDRIARAIAYLEQRIGALTGTDRDIGGNYDPERDYPHQMDCIDESRNSTTYLRLLDSLGLLRWHRPVERRYRSLFLIDGHWTAVVEEIETGKRWAVDSWYHDNGQPPEIQPLADWLKRKRPGRSAP